MDLKKPLNSKPNKLPALEDQSQPDMKEQIDLSNKDPSQPNQSIPKKEIQISQQTKERADAAKLFIERLKMNFSFILIEK